jgi:hypothetical protein
MSILNPTFSFFNCPRPKLIEPIHRDGVDPAVIGRRLRRPVRPAPSHYMDGANCWPAITCMLAEDLPPYGSPIELRWE